MKTRTCPYCNYKYSIMEYVNKFIFKHLWSEWKCIKCNNTITFNQKRRLSVAIASGIWYISLPVTGKALNITPVLWVLFFVAFIIGAFFIFTFDTFDKAADD